MDTDVYPKPLEQIESWDFEADVVIAGYGIAGAAAAVEAASAGADVHLPRWRHRNPTSLWFR